MNQPFLFIALDALTIQEEDTLKMAENLAKVEGNFGFKINLDYLLKRGLEGIVKMQQFNRPIFADLKMWNGTRTMLDVIKILAEKNVDYLNVYALADNLLPKAIQATEGSKTKILGLTVLTHFNENYCKKHFRRTLQETVFHFAEVAIKQGCHGIILPGTALDAVKDLATEKVVPGIRPKWYQDTRHEEKIEPKTAIEKGANILVCGSPIMKDIYYYVNALQLTLSEMG